MKRTAWLLASAWLVYGFNNPALASVQVTGEFTATQTCKAYQSIRRKTNPGNVQLETGKKYPIVELNVSSGTTWYRLHLDDATPAERWTYFECGTARVTGRDLSSNGHRSPGKSNECQTSGLSDSYVFAVSWQPAFCEKHSDKAECAVTDPDAYQANNFSLHGLWPNKKSCGTKYGFCGEYKKAKRPFCKFPPIPMQAKTLQALSDVMPSAASGTCLQRHEWYKHGTCQKKWDADGYFTIAIHLLKQFNDGGISTFMSNNIGKTVTSQSFFNVVDKAFGEDAHQRLQISCSGGMLIDVFINLPADPSNDISLKMLIQQAENKFQNKCGSSFMIDAIGQ